MILVSLIPYICIACTLTAYSLTLKMNFKPFEGNQPIKSIFSSHLENSENSIGLGEQGSINDRESAADPKPGDDMDCQDNHHYYHLWKMQVMKQGFARSRNVFPKQRRTPTSKM